MQDLTGCVILHSYRMGTSIQNLPEQEVFWKSVWGNLRNAIVGCSAAVLFGLAVLLMSIFSVTRPQSVFPQNTSTVAAEEIMVPPKVEYYLPYPGILPDNPLYNLKVIRDKLRLALTFDERKKAEGELLYADKRINAAKALIEGGKTGLGVSTATKAEKYLEKSVDGTIKLQKMGRDIRSLQLTLVKATAKHLELIQELMPKTSGDDRLGLENSLKLARMLGEKIAQAIRE